MQRVPRLLVAGVGCGVGKTAVVLALAAALRARGLTVAAFTLGPDGFDAPLLEAVTGRPAHCLDPWLMGRQTLRRTFERGTAGADIALVEGALGLFDGLVPTSDEGSSAELARWLELPLLLVLDGSNLGGSVAALARGFERFDARVPIGGVVANHVEGLGHAADLRAALEASGSARLLGALPVHPALRHPGRDLGSAPRDAGWLDDDRRGDLVRIGEQAFELDAVLALAERAVPLPPPLELVSRRPVARVGVALDEAFDRYFEDDLARLEAAGATPVPFSPLHDRELPDVDGLLFGDGNVEGHSVALAANRGMREAVRAALARGAPTLALGGGLVYLSRGVRALSGAYHRLVGAVPLDYTCTAEPALAGYIEAETTCETLIGPAGVVLRGHAWRHARLTRAAAEGLGGAEPLLQVRVGPEVHAYGAAQVLALPFRTHWASSPKVPEAFVAACVRASALLT